jgi:hypothetical protein
MIFLLSLSCGGAAKIGFVRRQRCLCGKAFVEKQLRHSRNNKLYTKIHFDTTLLILMVVLEKENPQKINLEKLKKVRDGD